MTRFRPVFVKTLILGGLIVFGFLLQTSVFAFLKLGGVSPNILLIVTVMIGFMRGRKEGMVAGFVCGLLMDMFFSSVFGMMTLLYLFIGYLNGVMAGIYYGDDVKFPMLLTGLSDMVYGGVIFVTMFLPRKRNDISFYFVNIMVPEVIYTVMVSIFIYMIVFQINLFLVKDEKRTLRLD